MENYSVYEDIANRTGGAIYVGVVGPVRTGKSTFIKRFMETLVIPFAKEPARAVMTDELPQAAAGKTVMTTEPKFVPAQAATVCVSKGAEASVRLVDCVGYAVEGANGFEEDGAPRLVKTPWQDSPMPFEEAAALGTEKVIKEHSTIGVLVTTDGSITDIPREAYAAAEERTVRELKSLDKPFVILLNCKNPEEKTELKNALEKKYETPVVALNVEKMVETDILLVLQKALFEFPVTRIDVQIPKWLQTLAEDNVWVHSALEKVRQTSANIQRMRDCFALENLFDEKDDFLNPEEIRMDMGKGKVEITLAAKAGLFNRVLGDICGESLDDDLALMKYMQSVAGVKQEYDKIKDAFQCAETHGYGIVYPTDADYVLEKPQLVKKGSGYGVQFRANAASYHVVKVKVTGEVSAIIGTKQQSEQFVGDTLKAYEESADGVWQTNIFGKTLRDLVDDELSGKNNAMSTELRRKMRRTLTRVINEGKTKLLCLLF